MAVSITVRQALTIGGLQYSRLVAGEAGLDRIIACVDVLEVPEPLSWIKENVLLVTTCYAVREDPEGQLKILRAMAKARSAALAIKFGRFIGQPPPDMVKMANHYNLPLIDVPDGISFMDITHPLMSAIINNHADQLEYSEKIHRKLTQLALGKNGISAIAGELAQFIGMAVAIYNDSLARLASSPCILQLFSDGGHLDAAVRKVLADNTREANRYRPQGTKLLTTSLAGYFCRIFPVEAQERCYGYILVIGHDAIGNLSEMQNIAIEHGVTVAALQLIRDDAVYEARQSYKRDLLEELIAGSLKSRETVISRGEMLELSLDQPYIIIMLAINKLPAALKQDKEEYEAAIKRFKDDLLRISETAFSAWPARVLAVPRGDSIVAIFPVIKKFLTRELRSRLLSLLEELQRQISRRWDDVSVTIGIGEVAYDPLSFSERYSEVKNAVKVARKVHGPGRTVFEDDMKVYMLLSGLGQPIEQFYQDVLGMIDNTKIKNREELLQTLRVYLECQGNIGEAAKKLFVHRNTLRYRLNRLKRLLGRDWEEADYRFTLLTALKARDLIISDRHREENV